MAKNQNYLFVHKLIKKIAPKYFVFGGVMTILIPFLLLQPLHWNNLKYIFFGLSLGIGFGYLHYKSSHPFIFSVLDLFWLLFIIICFSSCFWATNIGLIWYPAFGWLIMILWMLLFRQLSIDSFVEQQLPKVFFFFFLINMLHIVSVAPFSEYVGRRIWNHTFGYNHNYISAYMVCLYPFLLFYSKNTRLYNCIKILGTIFLFFLLKESNAKGAFISLIFVFLYFLWDSLPKKVFIGILASSAIILIGGIFFINNGVIGVEKALALEGFIGRNGSQRLFMLSGSFSIFKENPFLGIGLGNWNVEAYKYFDLGTIEGFSHTHHRFRLSNHNIFTQHLSELGILGFTAFIFPFFCLIWRGVYRSIKLTTFEKAAVVSTIVYLISSLFYRDVNLYEGHFSSMQILAFCNLGLLTGTIGRRFLKTKWILRILILLSVLCSFWFTYYKFTFDYIQKINKLEEEEIENKIELLENIYHPILKTTHGKYAHSANKSLALSLAQLYRKQNKSDKAAFYFEAALKDSPYNEYVLIDFARFLLRVRNNLPLAKKYAQRAFSQHSNFYETNLLLAEIAIEEKKEKEALNYLERAGLNKSYQVWILEQQLGNIVYHLDKLIKLTPEQRVILPELEKKNELKKLYFKSQLYKLEETNQEAKDLQGEVRLSMKEEEQNLLRVLTETQFFVYLKNRWDIKKEFERRLNKLTHFLSLTATQKEPTLNLITEIGIQEEYIKRIRQLPEIKKDKKKEVVYQKRLASLTVALDNSLFQILSEAQYKTYEIYKTKELKF